MHDYVSALLCISDDSIELINIVRHMQTYADDPLEDTLRNVFDFDVYKPETITKLGQILNHHGHVFMVLAHCTYRNTNAHEGSW